MYARKLAAVILLALPLGMIGPNRAVAQATPSLGKNIPSQVMDAPFPFQVAGQTLPAGKYDIEQPARDLLVFHPARGHVIEAPVLTRLAKPLTPLVEPMIIFDKVNDTYYISEVWLPGEDGFLLGGIKEPHTHVAVKATTKK